MRWSDRMKRGGGPGTRTPKGLLPAVFKTAALPVRSSPPGIGNLIDRCGHPNRNLIKRREEVASGSLWCVTPSMETDSLGGRSALCGLEIGYLVSVNLL